MTRFVLISDTFNSHRPLPKGDVLCHASGLSKNGRINELRKTLDWIDKADFEVKIVIAGSSNITLDENYYQSHHEFDQNPEDPEECAGLITSYPSIKFLRHEYTRIHLKSPSGPRTTFTIFGSPCMPDRSDGGHGVFGYDRYDSTGERLWAKIPLDTDIVLTHTPAYNHRDAGQRWDAAGCETLRKALWEVRPRLAICGRIHEARGVEKVEWNLGLLCWPILEKSTMKWTGLTRIINPLRNDGASGPHLHGDNVSFSSGTQQEETDDDHYRSPSEVLTTVSSSSGMPAHTLGHQDARNAQDVASQPRYPILSNLDDRDTDCLSGRMGRKDTIIANACTLGTGSRGIVTFKQAIVVDINLPVDI